jgi:hypothetical protein
MDQLDALEAAKLAAMVGGQLQNIDRHFTAPTNNPANKLNLNVFKAQVSNPGFKQKPANYLMDYPAGFVPPPDERLIQAQVPDPIPQIATQMAPQINPIPSSFPQAPQPEMTPLPHIVAPVEKKQKFEFHEPKVLFTRSDVDSIRNSLKNIDKTLSGMLTLLKNSNLVNTNE